MKLGLKFALALAVAFVVGCQPPVEPAEPVEPVVDAGPDVVEKTCELGPVECACENLCDLTCEECKPSCVPSINKILTDRLTRFDLECVTNSKTKVSVRMCPAIKCL